MDERALAASARSIEMLAISWACCCICCRLSIIRREFANVKLEISDFSFAVRQRFHRFVSVNDVSKMLFARGMSLYRSAWIESLYSFLMPVLVSTRIFITDAGNSLSIS